MINYTNYGMNLSREIFGSFVAISDFLHMIGQSSMGTITPSFSVLFSLASTFRSRGIATLLGVVKA